MACPDTCTGCTSCTDNCGCLYPSNTECVWYKGDAISCLDISSGDKLTDVLIAMGNAICDGIPGSSGLIYVVQGTTNEIDVSSSTVGDTTTYTVGLSDTILDSLSGLQSQIDALSSCCDDAIHEITTATPSYLDISDSGSNTWNIDFIGSIPGNYQGIIYNNTTFVNTNNTPGDQVLKSFNHNYVVDSDIDDGDDIRFMASGKVKAESSVVDSVKVELYDATGATVLWGDTIGGFNSSGISSFLLYGTLTVVDAAAGDGLYHLEFNANSEDNGTYDPWARNSGANIDVDVAGIDFTNLTIRIKFVHNTASSGTPDNGVRQLKVEVVKAI